MFLAFLRLGCVAFGGPVAHLGYFRTEFVQRRRWCTDETFAEVVALAQSLPGPASSQTGFTLGLLRAGLPGGLAAFVGFTLPSALLMLLFAFGQSYLDTSIGGALVHGLMLVAAGVVALAVAAMRKTLAPDRRRMAIAVIGLGLTLWITAFWGTLAVIGFGAAAGLTLLRTLPIGVAVGVPSPVSRRASVAAAILFVVFLFVPRATLFGAFYRTGALVFGGGHVVLPLLERTVVTPGWVSQPAFLAGYGAAQAVPGPLFSFAMYLGVVSRSSAWAGCVALAGLFLPGLLLILAALPVWTALRQNVYFRPALAGTNAAVLGILGAAFWRPIFLSSVHSALDFFLVVAAAFAFSEWQQYRSRKTA